MRVTGDPVTAVAYSLLFGVFNASMLSNGNFVWPAHFGRRHLGSIQGAAKTIGILGAALGPLPFGIAYDLSGDYRRAILVLILLPLALAVAVLFAHPPLAARQPASMPTSV